MRERPRGRFVGGGGGAGGLPHRCVPSFHATPGAHLVGGPRVGALLPLMHVGDEGAGLVVREKIVENHHPRVARKHLR